MTQFPRALRILDEVQHLAQLDALEPAAFVAAIGDEAPPAGATLAELEGQIDAVRGLLDAIDRFAQKGMRIRLLHLADAVPQQLRTLLSSTLVSYERDPGLL